MPSGQKCHLDPSGADGVDAPSCFTGGHRVNIRFNPRGLGPLVEFTTAPGEPVAPVIKMPESDEE